MVRGKHTATHAHKEYQKKPRKYSVERCGYLNESRGGPWIILSSVRIKEGHFNAIPSKNIHMFLYNMSYLCVC